MNSRIAKTFVAIAAILAATGAWADTTVSEYRNKFETAEIFTFSELVTGNSYVWIGSAATENPFEEGWAVWVSQDGTENCGINQTADSMRMADAANQKGRLRIESGYYKTPKFDIGNKGIAYLTINGGKIETTGDFNIGINGATTEFLMTGGEVIVGSGAWWASDDNTTATATLSNGTMTIKGSLTLIHGNGSTGTINIGEGGKLICNSDVLLANGGDATSTATININNGGVGENQTTSGGAIWIKLSNSGTAKSVVNINEGGTVKAWHFQQISTGESEINFNGGTVVALGSDSKYNKYLFGDTDNKGNDAHLTITVGENGGTIDTNGKDITINKEIAGTGTLTIAGGGSVTFLVAPTCEIKAVDGSIVKLAEGATLFNIELGTGCFVEYDLSSVTESAVTTNIAENVTITVPEGDSVGEHVIIKNGGVFWNVTYSGTTLSATSTSDTTALSGGYTIWTGYYNSDTPTDQIKSWVNGYPGPTTKVIIPFDSTMKQYQDNIKCGDVVLYGDLTLQKYVKNDNKYKWKHFRPRSVSGEGTIKIDFGEGYGYFESQLNQGNESKSEINVPVVVTGTPILTGSGDYPLNFNKAFTVNAGARAKLNGDNNVNFLAGELVLNNKVPVLQSDIGGGGTINGSFATTAGAKIVATVTNENATAECLTVTGNADLANATVEIAGGELVADAAYGTEIVLFKAGSISNWTSARYVIPGQDKTWKIKEDTLVEGETTYAVLKAVKNRAGFVIFVQ